MELKQWGGWLVNKTKISISVTGNEQLEKDSKKRVMLSFVRKQPRNQFLIENNATWLKQLAFYTEDMGVVAQYSSWIFYYCQPEIAVVRPEFHLKLLLSSSAYILLIM